MILIASSLQQDKYLREHNDLMYYPDLDRIAHLPNPVTPLQACGCDRVLQMCHKACLRALLLVSLALAERRPFSTCPWCRPLAGRELGSYMLGWQEGEESAGKRSGQGRDGCRRAVLWIQNICEGHFTLTSLILIQVSVFWNNYLLILIELKAQFFSGLNYCTWGDMKVVSVKLDLCQVIHTYHLSWKCNVNHF